MQMEANNSDSVPSPLKEISGIMTILINTILVSTNILCLLSLVGVSIQKSKFVELFDFYVISLSAIDIFECLIPGSIWVTYELTTASLIGSFSCTIYKSTVNSLQILSLSVIFTMNLYCWITSSFNLHPLKTLRFFIFSLISCVILTIVFIILTLIPSNHQTSTICLQLVLSSKYSSIVSFIHLVLFLTMAFLLLGGCVMCTVFNLRFRDARSLIGVYTVQGIPSSCNVAKKPKLSLHKITALITLFQVLTWLPFLLSLTIIHCCSSLPVLAVHFLSLSTQLNGAFNPLIYAIFSKKYRSFYRRLMPNICRKNNENTSKTNRNPNKIYIHRSLCTTEFSLYGKTVGHNQGPCQHSPLDHLVSFSKCDDIECDAAGKEIIMRKFLEDNPIFDSLE